MAMPPVNVPAGNWIPDQRDGFISWLRMEFAAANAIIDSLCQHLEVTGDHNEYETVIRSINYRRLGWSQYIAMQQFYPITDVTYNLQQVTWNRQQQRYGGKRSGLGFSKHHGGYRGVDSMVRNGHYSNPNSREEAQLASDVKALSDEKIDGSEKSKSDSKDGKKTEDLEEPATHGDIVNHNCNSASTVCSEKSQDGKKSEDLEESATHVEKMNHNCNSASTDGSEKSKIDSKDGKKTGDLEEPETHGEIVNHTCTSASTDNSLSSKQKQEECPASMAKTFVVQEMYEAKMVNVVEGLKLYDKMLDEKEISQLVSLVNNLRNAGRRGLLQNGAYMGYKRPNRGHGREMIQLGLQIADTPPDDENIKDRKVEPIPSVLSDIIERLVTKQVVPAKPDACIIDFFNEGDYSQPHMFVPWFGRPVGILSLSECDFTFGRVIVSDHPGDFKGSLKLSITPGSVLLVEGKSADLAKYAIDSTRKQRILIIFIKSRPRNSVTGSNWGPPPPSSRSPNHHIRYPTVPPKHYPVTLTNGVLPTPSHRPPNGAAQPIFISPSPPLAPFTPPGQTGWPVLQAHPRNQPRMLIPGTGVFLPPGSTQELVAQDPSEQSNNSNISSTSAEEEACNETTAGESNGSRQSN